MSTQINQIPFVVFIGERHTLLVSFTPDLTPTHTISKVEIHAKNATIPTFSITDTQMTINGVVTPAGQGVQFTMEPTGGKEVVIDVVAWLNDAQRKNCRLRFFSYPLMQS